MTEKNEPLNYHRPHVSVFGGVRHLTQKKAGVKHDSPKDNGASKSK
jgi:hypothetical protein